MNRPISNSAPARRRITPIAVSSQDANIAAMPASEQPLHIGPAFATGNTKDVSACGPGRRVWVDIQGSIVLKFKDVLRQQGLDYATWQKDVQQRRAKLEGAPQGPDAKRQGFTGRLYQRVQGLYQASDEEETSDRDNTDEGTTSDATPEGGAADGDEAAGSDEGDDDSSDDEKEGNETGGEIDLDREEGCKKKPKRQRFERYDDDFIDDSELEMVKGAAKEVKTKFTGFYAVRGDVEVIEEPTKSRSKPKPRAPKPAAHDAANSDGTAAGATKKRKQQDKQQQQQQQHKEGTTGSVAAAAASNGLDASRKKRQRHEVPAAPAATGFTTSDKPPAPKRVKPTPVVPGRDTPAASGGASAAGAAGNADAGGAAPASAAAVAAQPAGTAGKAVQAALQAAKKKRIQPEQVAVTEAQPPAAAAVACGSSSAGVGQIAAGTSETQQPPNNHVQQQDTTPAAAPAAEAAGGAGAPAPAAVSGASGGTGDGQDVTAAAVAAGLPEHLVAAMRTLQEKVIEHKPGGGEQKAAVAMSKPVKQAVRAVGFTFLHMPVEQQQRHQNALVQVLQPLMLPYGKEKKLRKELFEVPHAQLEEVHQKTTSLLLQLDDMKQLRERSADAGADDDDFQSAPWTADAEQALVEAWKAAEAQPVGEALQQLATAVFERLERPQQPANSLEELRLIHSKAKRKAKKDKAQSTAGGGTPQPTGLHQQPSISMDAVTSLPASRQSPAPDSLAAVGFAPAAAAAASAGKRSSTPAPTPVKAERAGSAGAAANLQSGAGASVGAVATGSMLTQGKREQERFSTWQAPSPRLRRCIETAEAAGALREWLEQNYPKPNSAMLNQIYRVLCMAGPEGCSVKNMVAKAAEYQLGFAWEDNANQRAGITQSVHNTQAGLRLVGLTEDDPSAYALLGFKGVMSQPAKPTKPAKSADAGGGAADDGNQQSAD